MQEQTESTAQPDWQGLVFRALRQEDLRYAWELSQAARWPHRLEDWQFFFSLGRGVAVLDAEQLIGVAMRWDFSTCETLGLIIVSETHRGRRIASRLVADALREITAPAALLHATPEGAGVYARQGFEVVGQICQHQGEVVDGQQEVPPSGWTLRPALPGDVDVLAELDCRACGLSRRDLMQALLESGEGVVLEKSGHAVGFSVLRRFGRGDVIGPVVAEDEKDARILISHWLTARVGRFVRIDIPSELGIANWLTTAGLVRVDTGARMVRGKEPVRDDGIQTYALVSQAVA